MDFHLTKFEVQLEINYQPKMLLLLHSPWSLSVIIKAKQDVVTIMTIRMRNLRTMTIAQSVTLGQQKVGKLGKKQGKWCERCSRSNVMITHSSSELLTCHAKGSRPPKKKHLHLNNTAWKINICDNLGWFIHALLNFAHNLPNWFLKLPALWWNWDIVELPASWLISPSAWFLLLVSVWLQLVGLRCHSGLGEHHHPPPIVLDNPRKVLDTAANLLLSAIAENMRNYSNLLKSQIDAQLVWP